jgi:cell division protein FtsW
MFSENRYVNYGVRLKETRQELLFVFLTLAAAGLLFVYDVSSVYAWWTSGDPMFFLKRHLAFVLLGLVGMFVCLRTNLDTLRRWVKPMIIVMLVLLIAVFVLGKAAWGAKRWFHIGGFSFQPSEFAKIVFILYAADYLERKRRMLDSITQGIAPLLIVTLMIAGLIVIEPDLGNASLICILMFSMMWIAGLPKKYVLAVGAVGLAGVVALIAISPYRMARVVSFLDPWADAQGKGFQLVQSHIALGSGGLFGRGLGESVQKLFFLPAVHTDFIFAIIGEELGLIGCVVMLCVFLFAFMQGIRIVRTQQEYSYRYFIGFGIMLLFVTEALLNMAVVTGMMPTKGLPMPFISYGGSSTIANFMMLGLFFNATKPHEA